MKKLSKYLLVILLAVAVGSLYHFHSGSSLAAGGGKTKTETSHAKSGGGKHGDKNAAVPVGVAAAKLGDIPVFLQGLGNITPRSTVTVHTLVNGQLMKVLFSEGQMVKKGAMLAQIDDRPYVAALEQAQGLQKRDEALLAEAKVDLDRYKTLWAQDSVAKQQLDQQASLVKQYEGAVLNDQGQADNARVNLAYTKITSPVTGRVGLRLVDPGNIVHTSDSNGIVVVTELQPITAIFSIPEDSVPTVMQHIGTGDRLAAEAWDRDNKKKIADGTLTAIDNQVDPTTGMVRFRAEYANADNSLFPSQFVNIHLQLDTLKNVVTIPTAAVQRGVQASHETFVYLVKPDNTVAVQNVTLGPASGENVSVTQGISVGDQVVVDGTDNLRDGAKIIIDAGAGGASAALPSTPAAAPKDEAAKDEEKPHHRHHKDAGGDKG